MQLVAYGAQDIYLTGNPQITFFKVVYRRHTNFSMEAIQQTLNGTFTGDLAPGAATATGAAAETPNFSSISEISSETSSILADSRYPNTSSLFTLAIFILPIL